MDKVSSLVDKLRQSAPSKLLSLKSGSVFNPSASSDGRINITIRLWDRNGKRSIKDTPFVIKPTSPLKNVLHIYAVRETEFPECLGYFKFMVGTREVSHDDCAEEVALNDGDCIDAMPCEDDLVGGRFV